MRFSKTMASCFEFSPLVPISGAQATKALAKAEEAGFYIPHEGSD